MLTMIVNTMHGGNIVLIMETSLKGNGQYFTFFPKQGAKPEGVLRAWGDIYSVLVIVFGQSLPDAAASAVVQLFALVVAGIGFLSFALVIAIVENVRFYVSLACLLLCFTLSILCERG